jgi:GGDEF domain-containing protein
MLGASVRFEKLLKSTLNKSDLIMQNRVNQFCVLITNRDEKEAEAITERLLKAWDENEQNANMKIQYAVKFCEKQIR